MSDTEKCRHCGHRIIPFSSDLVKWVHDDAHRSAYCRKTMAEPGDPTPPSTTGESTRYFRLLKDGTYQEVPSTAEWTPPSGNTDNGPTLAEIDPALIAGLTVLASTYGGLGIIHTACLLWPDTADVAARADLAEMRGNYDQACQTIALMHAAAVGEVTGPRTGVVEDVAAVAADLAAVRAELVVEKRHSGQMYAGWLKGDRDLRALQERIAALIDGWRLDPSRRSISPHYVDALRAAAVVEVSVTGPSSGQRLDQVLGEIAERRADTEFMDRVAASVAKHRPILDRLGARVDDGYFVPQAPVQVNNPGEG